MDVVQVSSLEEFKNDEATALRKQLAWHQRAESEIVDRLGVLGVKAIEPKPRKAPEPEDSLKPAATATRQGSSRAKAASTPAPAIGRKTGRGEMTGVVLETMAQIGPATAGEIAERMKTNRHALAESLPTKMLTKRLKACMAHLVEAGLLKKVGGYGGGYELVQAPQPAAESPAPKADVSDAALMHAIRTVLSGCTIPVGSGELTNLVVESGWLASDKKKLAGRINLMLADGLESGMFTEHQGGFGLSA